MITNVYKAIRRHLRTLTVDVFTGEDWVDGENVQTFSTGVEKELAILPLSNRDLKFLPDGVYTFQDKKIYEIGSGTVADKSLVYLGNDKYLIEGGTQRDFEGGFTMYIGRRVDD